LLTGNEPIALVLTSPGSDASHILAVLEAEGFATVVAADDAEAYREILRGVPDLVVADTTRENVRARETILVGLLATGLRPPFVVATREVASKAAASLLRRGAFGCLRLPFDPDEARIVFRRAFEASAKARERTVLLADLEAMRALFQDTLLNVLDGVLIVDANSQVLFANDEAARILLQERDQLVGSRLDPNLSASLFKLLKMARASPDRSAAEESELVSGNERFRFFGRASIVHDHLGKPVGGLLVLRALDTTDDPGAMASGPAANASARSTPAPATRASEEGRRPTSSVAPAAPKPAPPRATTPTSDADAAKRTASFMISSILASLGKRDLEDPAEEDEVPPDELPDLSEEGLP
jgi:PAS domain-containing protein